MTKDEQAILEENFKKILQKVRDSGLSEGMKCICGIVLEKANDDKKTDAEKLADITDFCNRSLGLREE